MQGTGYDIAVMGESMAGKSTWISALCREDVAETLGEIYRENRQSQTKTTVHYLLKDTAAECFDVESVTWNYEKLAGCLREGQDAEPRELFTILGLSVRENVLDEDLEMSLKEYLESGEALADIRKSQTPPELIRNIVNSSAFGESGFISHIEISVPAAPEVWKEIAGRGLDFVRLRDTRGFLDESAGTMQERMEHVKKRRAEKAGADAEADLQDCVQDLQDERGISGADAIAFISIANSNALSKKIMRDMYGTLITDMLEKHPVFLTVRSDELTKQMAQESRTYVKSCSSILQDTYFSGLDAMRELLDDYRQNDGSPDYRKDIARKNYRELLLANFPAKLWKEDGTQEKEIYRACAAGAFSEMMDGIDCYHKNLETAEQCLQAIGNPAAKLKELYDGFFQDTIADFGIEYQPGAHFYSTLFGSLTEETADKLSGPYFGGLVGKRGGLTTYIPGKGRVGQCAIFLLEAAHMAESVLLPELVEKLEPEIERYVRQWVDDAHVLEMAKEEKKNLYEKYVHHLESDFERLFCTDRMVKLEYLQAVHSRMKPYFQNEYAAFRGYSAEWEVTLPESAWEADRDVLAALKYAVWHLMALDLHLDEVELNGKGDSL